MRNLTIFCTFFIAGMVHASGSNDDIQVDCNIIKLPDYISETISVESPKRTETHEPTKKFVRSSSFVNKALRSFLKNDYVEYEAAIQGLQSNLRESDQLHPEIGSLVLSLYFYTYGWDFPQINDDIIYRAIEATTGKSTDVLFEEKVKVAGVLFDLQHGIESSVDVYLDRIGGTAIRRDYLGAYLHYQIANTQPTIRNYQKAVDSLKTLTNNGELKANCDKSTYGMALYYLAEANHSLASLMARKRTYEDEEIRQTLLLSRDVVDQTHAYFDPLYRPRMWTNAYSLRADVYDQLTNYERMNSRSFRYKIIGDTAREIADRS